VEKEKNGKELVLKTEELEDILKIEHIRTNLLCSRTTKCLRIELADLFQDQWTALHWAAYLAEPAHLKIAQVSLYLYLFKYTSRRPGLPCRGSPSQKKRMLPTPLPPSPLRRMSSLTYLC